MPYYKIISSERLELDDNGPDKVTVLHEKLCSKPFRTHVHSSSKCIAFTGENFKSNNPLKMHRITHRNLEIETKGLDHGANY